MREILVVQGLIVQFGVILRLLRMVKEQNAIIVSKYKIGLYNMLNLIIIHI